MSRGPEGGPHGTTQTGDGQPASSGGSDPGESRRTAQFRIHPNSFPKVGGGLHLNRTAKRAGGTLGRLGGLMATVGALGVVVMAILGADPVSAQSLPTTGTLYLTCYANQGSSGSNCTTGSDVQKVTYTYNGTALTMGTPTAVANTQGADGIQFLPNGDLVIGGQQSGTVSEVTPSGTLVKKVASGMPEVDHISVAPQGLGGGSYVTAGGYSGHGLNLLPIGSNGQIEPGIACTLYNSSAPTTPISSTGFVMDTIVWVGSQAYYTESLPNGPGGFFGGYGAFGAINITYNSTAGTCSAQLTQLLTGLPSAHGMAFDPATGSIITFGAQMIAQIGITPAAGNAPMSAKPISEITFGGESCWDVATQDCLQESGYPMTGSSDTFDQGAVDGFGHLFVSNNNGYMAFVDYSQAPGHLISQASYVSDKFLTNSLDDIAPLAGAGGTLQVNTVPVPAVASPGQVLSDSVQVINPDTYWPAGDQAPYVQIWLNSPSDPTCQAGSATMKSGWIPYTASSGTIVWTPSATYPATDLTTTPSHTTTTWNPAWDVTPGTYRWVVNYYYWDVATGKMAYLYGACNAEQVTVGTPSISTLATPSLAPVGTSFSDSATITNPPAAGLNPQVTFSLYQGTSCASESKSAYYVSPAESVVNGKASSPAVNIPAAGPYQWQATLTYDNGGFAQSQCGSEQVGAVGTPTITTTPTSGGAVGTTLSDAATIQGLYDPAQADTVNFALYSNASCSAAGLIDNLGTGALGTSTLVAGVPTWTVSSPSPGYAPTIAQTYYWGVTFTPVGDIYNGTVSTCGEPVSITPGSGVHGANTGGGSGGVLGASTPGTGSDLFLPGLLASIALLLGGLMLGVGTTLRRRPIA